MSDTATPRSPLRFLDGAIACEQIPSMQMQIQPPPPSLAATSCAQACPTVGVSTCAQMCPTLLVTSCIDACPTEGVCPTAIVSSCVQMCETLTNACLAPPPGHRYPMPARPAFF
ncbi:MAG TPA: hypothetical protein VJ276_20305 [Thermoanaerobaculia bacterium]|nr:hypothetical protein [Thermoanaerobaculia bacterium]